MAVRNGAAYLDRAIASIVTQTMADLELVVVDDGSTDGTPAILAAWTGRDTRIRAFRQEQRGIYTAANLGISESRAQLIARLDADDMAVPDRLEKQVAWFDANPNVAVLGGWMISIDTDDRKLRLHTYLTDPPSVRQTLRRGPALAHPTVMMRKAVFLRLGG